MAGAAVLSPLWLRRLREAIADAFHIRAAFLAEADARRLFLWLPVCMGIGVALFLVADGVPRPWPALAAAGVLLALAWWRRASLLAPVMLTGAAFVFLGFAAMALRTERAAAPVLDKPAFARLSGFVETVDAGPAGGRMVLVLTRFETAFPVTEPRRLRTTFQGPAPRAGDHISGQARLMPPPQPAFPGGYDFARDAYFLGLGAVGRWVGPMTLTPAASPSAFDLRVTAAIDNARTDMTNRIASVIGGQAGALSAALVTGKRGLLSEAVNDDLRASGLYHIVSISGLHMVLAAGVFFWLARAVLALIPGVAERWPIKKWAACLAMLGATAYCVFSGSEVATERSLIMTLVLLGAILFDRPALSMRNLAIAALIVLAREPETMAGPSFQMSFAAVAAMIAAHEWWLSLPREPKEPAGWGGILLRKGMTAILASLMTTLIASFATAPFAAYHFQRMNPYGLIGNALAIPFVSFVVMPAAVGGTLLMPFGLDGPIWQAMGLGSDQVLAVARFVALIDGSVRGVRAFPIVFLLWMAAGFIVFVLVRSPLRLAGLAGMIAAGAAAAAVRAPDLFIDRQGQVAAIRAEDGKLQILGRAASRFTVDRWLSADGDLRKANDPALKRSVACDRWGCTAPLADGAAVALVLQPEAFEEDCRRARLVITPLAAPAFCAATAQVIDRGRLGQAASLALYRGPAGFAEVPARGRDGWKPWFGRPENASPAATPPQVQSRNPAARAPPDPDPAPDPNDDGADMILP
ncbi:MAG: ComEC/Rec2 family competence protein [Methylocystis sp.]|nr:ComEC/Rec2 family competence protein [Methylocystis sp.]MCA3586220.1 ComEC/Rec2 family competence protein [Methylocystis sp.]MCA3587439.1 ComEC/Rec2 family competence protein [Methylocystis sp.]MCA3592696.1 ComEC/Rec2 family competence protein [Methylocystis sp.]